MNSAAIKMTLQGDYHSDDVVVVMASSVPPGYEQPVTGTPATEIAAAAFGGENSDSDYRYS